LEGNIQVGPLIDLLVKIWITGYDFKSFYYTHTYRYVYFIAGKG